MKKLSLIIVLVFTSLLLIGIYFVGEKTQQVLYEQVKNIDNSAIQVESLSYQKSFFTAQSEIKIAIPVQEQSQLKLIIRSEIIHYPYKAKAINQLIFMDPKLTKDLLQFFQTEQWLASILEMNLFGGLTGEIKLAEGVFNDQVGRIQILPSQLLYSYNINDQQGAFSFKWGGFNGEVDNGQLAIDDMFIEATLSQHKKTKLADYQIQIQQFDFTRANQHLQLTGVSLQGDNQISENQFTLNSKNTLQVEGLKNDLLQFTNNKMQLSLTGINVVALANLKNNLMEKTFEQRPFGQALSELISLGGKIELDDLQSDTPWGKVIVQLDMLIQQNVGLKQVTDNPLSLLDYSNGELSVSLPDKLTEQPDIGHFLQMGLNSGVFNKQEQQLILEANLDRGQLTINNKVIPF